MLPTITPLKNVRALDVSRVLAGPFCGQVLGDLGADVIKVERPRSGDETRQWGPPFVGELSAYYLSCNRNKRAITLDLSRPEGQTVFQQLIAKSDVLIENFRTSTTRKLGVTPAQLWARNPKLVICSISGFGRDGPWQDRPGYDFAIQALSGLMSITGPAEGPPFKVGVAVTNVLTGLYSAIAILACLKAREESEHGYAIDLSLLDCALAAQVNVAQAFLSSGEVPPRQGNAHLQIVPYQLFRTSDGWLVLAVGNDAQWKRFCAAAEKPDLGQDPRFATNPLRVENREELEPIGQAILQTKTTQEWEDLLEAANVPRAPVNDYDKLFSSEHAKERGLRVTITDSRGNPVDLLGSPFQFQETSLPEPTAPPTLSQHTEEVLGELLGMPSEQIRHLRNEGIV